MTNTKSPYRGKAEENPICKIHPESTWGISPFTRRPYPKCREGNKKNEDCERIKV